MRKTGRPWYREGTDSWYVWHEGRQVSLAKGKKNKAAAYARFAEMLGAEPSPITTPRPAVTIKALIEAYQSHIRERIKPTTYTAYVCILDNLSRECGTVPASDLKTAELEDWARRQNWRPTTRRYGLTVVVGVFRWATRGGFLGMNPIRDLQLPPARSRGAEILIDQELHAELLSVVSPELQDFLEAVRGTGARPGEVARVEAKDVVWEASCWVLREHKTASTGRVRTIFLPANVLAICRRLATKHPVGPLFRNTKGAEWRKTGWKQGMARAQLKLGLERRPMVSGYRHTFATDALENGVPDAHVAELLGHASTAMLHRHYSHLTAKAQVLRSSLELVRGQRQE